MYRIALFRTWWDLLRAIAERLLPLQLVAPTSGKRSQEIRESRLDGCEEMGAVEKHDEGNDVDGVEHFLGLDVDFEERVCVPDRVDLKPRFASLARWGVATKTGPIVMVVRKPTHSSAGSP